MDLFEFLLGGTILTVLIGPPLVAILLYLYFRKDYRKHHRLDFEDKRLVAFGGIISQRPYFFNLFISLLIYKSPDIYQKIMYPAEEGIALQVAPFVTLAMLASNLVSISLSIRRARDVTGAELSRKAVILISFFNLIPILSTVGLFLLGLKKTKSVTGVPL